MTTGNLREKAYQHIRQLIISCELMPGDPIQEQDLMAAIGVSRTPIREALSKLENENLVKIYPKRGCFVTPITVKDVMDIYTVRESVEPLAARLAAPVIQLEGLKPYYDLYADPNHSYTLDEHMRVDREFHSFIAQSTGNQFLAQILMGLYDQNSRVRILSKLRVKERQNEAREEHFELIRCFMDRDESRAFEVMQRHVSNGKRTALQIVR